MYSRRILMDGALVVTLLVPAAAAHAGGTIVPIDQERLTSSLVGYTRCGVESSSGAEP